MRLVDDNWLLRFHLYFLLLLRYLNFCCRLFRLPLDRYVWFNFKREFTCIRVVSANLLNFFQVLRFYDYRLWFAWVTILLLTKAVEISRWAWCWRAWTHFSFRLGWTSLHSLLVTTNGNVILFLLKFVFCDRKLILIIHHNQWLSLTCLNKQLIFTLVSLGINTFLNLINRIIQITVRWEVLHIFVCFIVY